MKPVINPVTLRCLEKAKLALSQAGEIASEAIRKGIAQGLLDRFQSRIRTKVQFVTCDRDFWLSDPETNRAEPFRNLCAALDDVANPLVPGVEETYTPHWRITEALWRYRRRVMERFPELVELWHIAYELDAMPGRPGLGEISPAHQSRTSRGIR